MKKMNHLFTLMILSVIFFGSCQQQEQPLSEENTIEKRIEFNANAQELLSRMSNPDNSISLTTFNSWKRSWESHWNDQYISYFTMPLSNLQNIINTNDVEEARLYLGYSESENGPHLMLAGVNADGESMIGESDRIYNLTLPCPDVCCARAPEGFVFPPSGHRALPPNTISIETFDAWNRGWETRWDDNYIESFTMPLDNLRNLVNTNGVVAARFYLGYSERQDMPHLTLVGVNAAGESMIGENAYIYDTSKPCPPFCPR